MRQPLAEQGLLKRLPNPDDRRAWLLELTPEGAKQVQHITKVLEQSEKAIPNDIPHEFIEHFLKAAEHINYTIQRLQDKNKMTDFIHATASRLHLATGRIRFVLHTFSAAAISIFLAIGLGLEHPNWSAMGALSSSQPTRERIFLKGSLRVAGSVIGTIVGVLILLLTSADHLLVITLLSLWVGFCVVGTIILRGLFSYFAIVS